MMLGVDEYYRWLQNPSVCIPWGDRHRCYHDPVGEGEAIGSREIAEIQVLPDNRYGEKAAHRFERAAELDAIAISQGVLCGGGSASFPLL